MQQQKKFNFGAGPCILPPEVLIEASHAVENLNNSGLSILEISHRSPAFAEIVEKTRNLIRELLRVPDDYSILLMQGGASTQFSMIPLNFINGKKRAAYLDAGFFSLKAIREAGFFGEPDIVASSKDNDYCSIPQHYQIPSDAAYFHCTSNNTIEGTEMFAFPDCSVPLICDMSSDIFSRSINVDEFDLIYAGAQKNMGPAGLTVVIVKNSLLDTIDHPVPSMSDYRVYRDNDSLYNTPPVFSIYVTMLNLEWLKKQGGIQVIERRNREKAALLYQQIDLNPLFVGTVSQSDRSRMNVCFRMEDPSLEAKFLEYAESRGMVGIKGFPTRGGFRVSLYNAMPLSSVRELVKTMEEFSLIQKDAKVMI